MAVLAAESGMNSEENDRNSESSHKSNLHFDRQLQNKLLQIDEDSDTESYETKLSKSWSNVKGGAKSFKPDSRVEDITGWFPSAKFVGRKPENALKGESKPANTFIHPWRDYRSKKEESFVFRHYKEFRKYMEQYRNEHSCQPNRFSSGNQFGEMRRFAFQNSAPPQQTPVMVQQMHQPVHINSAPPSSINGNQSSMHYSNRAEQLGTLVTPSSNCSCNKQSANIGSSQPQRYGSIPSQYMRTNTNYDIRHMDSDNMSETGDLRHRAPSRRTNSASSTRSRSVTAKTPTKISVPASPNARAYPVQALTMQQNGKTEHPQTPKPLDNLNCVAPEKQMDGLSSTDSESDDGISLDQLSICPLSADLKIRKSQDMVSENLKQFLHEDPVLSSLNQKPELQPDNFERENPFVTTKVFDRDSFQIPENDMDSMLRVNMWNPILSTVPKVYRKEFTSQNYRNLMTQLPFRIVDEPVRVPKPIQNDLNQSVTEKLDFFSPSKKVRLSITRLDNAVSFCRTQVQSFKKDQIERKSSSLTRLSSGSAPSILGVRNESGHEPVVLKLKPPILDPFAEKLTKPTKFEQKLNLPAPQVKILESLPIEKPKEIRVSKSPNFVTRSESRNAVKKMSISEPQVVNCDEFNTETDKMNAETQKAVEDKPVNNDEKKEFTEDTDETNGDDVKILFTNTNVMKGVQGIRINIDSRKVEKTENTDTEKTTLAPKKPVKKPAVASGKYLKSHQELDGLTWAEKLQVLRSVNKPREKPKPKQQKIKFMKGDPNDPVYLWSLEHDQLYEQRRIRHLVEQARIKGGKQFDWMKQYEAEKVRDRGTGWEVEKVEEEEREVGSGASSDEEEICEAGDRNLGKYGIYVPPKGVRHKLFNAHNRSKTFIAP